VIVSTGTGITILIVISSLTAGILASRATSTIVIGSSGGGAAGIITAIVIIIVVVVVVVVIAGVVGANSGGLRLRVVGIGVVGSSGRSVGVGGG